MKETIKIVHQKTVMPFVDLILGKTMSKKLLVFFIATVYVALKHIDSAEWVDLAKVYIGSQAVVDITEAIKGNFKHHKSGNE